MGIQNRDYYRECTSSSGSINESPVVKYLIIANVLVFLAQILFVHNVRVSPLNELKKRHPELVKDISDDDLDLPAFGFRSSRNGLSSIPSKSYKAERSGGC